LRTVLRIFGFAALIISGELLCSPIFTAFIPGCPYPPEFFYPTGIAIGHIGVFLFWAVDLLGRSHRG
jgi:hypothetical protein